MQLLSLIFGGIISGLVHFFIQYVELPYDLDKYGPKSMFSDKPELTWKIAMLGYSIIGIAGSLLVYVIDAWVTLKGLNDSNLIVLGYAIIFGFFAISTFKKSWAIIFPEKIPQSNTLEFRPNNYSANNYGLIANIESDDLLPGQKVPNLPQQSTSAAGPFQGKIVRGSSNFDKLITNSNSKIVFKDEEGTGADKLFMYTTSFRLDTLAELVEEEWKGLKLRVTDGWDEDGEHSPHSLHYEGRAADITISDIDKTKLGRLGRLAVQSGFDWVLHEHNHVHVSCKRDFQTGENMFV